MELRISFGKDNDELLFYAENDELDIKECITTLTAATEGKNWVLNLEAKEREATGIKRQSWYY